MPCTDAEMKKAYDRLVFWSRIKMLWHDIETKEAYELHLWEEKHVARRAPNVRAVFFGCKHIIEIDWKKLFIKVYQQDEESRYTATWEWQLRSSFIKQYAFPHCDIEDHAAIIQMRGTTNPDTIFERNEFGTDAVFVGTNSDAQATMIALKYK